MAQIISASIDLAKIDKSRIKDRNNGQKYYDISIIINDEEDSYGNTVAVTEGQTKEERDAKARKNYLGNGKVVWSSNATASTPAPRKAPPHAPKVDPDLGF